jgi:general secretion pathway protein G
MNIRTNKGFTLIELIVVISIIGVLASLLMTNFMQVREKTRDGVRKSDLQQIRLALESYRLDEGHYPPASEGLYTTTCDGFNSLQGDEGTEYMKDIPCDPKIPDKTYLYTPTDTSSRPLGYTLMACAENENDQETIAISGTYCNTDGFSEQGFVVTNP